MNKLKKSPIKYFVLITLFFAILLATIVVLKEKSEDKGEVLDSHPSTENQPTLGEKDAPVSVVEFGDYKCPACKSWGETIYPALKEEFIDTGKANFSYVNVLFHGAESQLSSLAAESVYNHDPDSYWAFHKGIYDEQPEQESAWVTVDKMLEIAEKTTNMDIETLKQDLEKQTFIDEVEKDASLVSQYSVNSTPTIIINGTKLENPFDYDQIKSLIEEGQE
ncbi:DsbA family protein [Bacillus spongiae]|uniref:DsbA family protein n=1 Tax=Bacillus spongiae TaxID=2683610 RepID=A0ABU8HEH3_9BACI